MSGEAPAPAVLTLRLPNRLSSIEQARRSAVAHLSGHGLDARVIYAVELILEEVLMNVALHAFDEPAGGDLDLSVEQSVHRSVGLSVDLTDDGVRLSFDDTGRAFDPTQAEPAPLPASLDEARVGGLGLALVRKTAKRIHYQRACGHNLLTIDVARA